ncbi:PHO86 [Candida pseudojiufengensis]|uniref:PHO86 n=1 Tax=Candida pseudojiufengensis TaxID=497109 RepID=UPI0022242EDB|nr:PHO86 [Candida pseudojiufengensis]KAI5966425.1 PHO86 [Candida pseudojiufengensis]
MIEQKEIDLNSPLDANKPATLVKTSLRPDLSKAALILHGDYYKQSQSNLTRYVFWHPFSIMVYTTLIPVILGFVLWDYISVSENLYEFYLIAMRNKNDFIFNILRGVPVIASIFASFGFISYIVGEDVGSIANNLVNKNYCDDIFGFKLTEFVKEKNKIGKNGENSNLISYREQPIAIVTLKPDLKQSTVDNFIVQISGIHVRKVFQKVDFDNLLIEWAVLRSRELYQEYLKNSKSNVTNGSIFITTSCYSFNKNLFQALLNNGFKIIDQSYEFNPFEPTTKPLQKFVYKLIGATNNTFGIVLSTNEEDFELIKNNELLEKSSSTSTEEKNNVAKKRS